MSFTEHNIVWDDAKVSRLWDFYSRTPPYSDVYFSKLFGGEILKRSKLPPGQALEVLDFGCGPGFLWQHISGLRMKWLYTGLDFSADSVAKLNSDAQGHAQFKGALHVTRLPSELADATFDAVLLVEVVEHLNEEHLASTLNEVSRVLKRGGVVIVTTPNEEDLSKSTKFCPECGAIYHEWQHVRSWSVASLARRLERHGFELRFAQVLDFSAAHILRKLFLRLRALRRGNRIYPHMLSVFQKV